jgi:hypothetical protein
MNALYSAGLRHRSACAVAVLLATLAVFWPSRGDAQSAGDAAATWSLEDYEAMRAALDAADARLFASKPRTDERDAATNAVREQASALIDYLTAALRDPAFPPQLVGEATTQRFVLFENLVQLHADARECDAADNAALAMRAVMPRDASPELRSLVDSAGRVASACMDWTPDAVIRDRIERHAHRPRRAGWALISMGTGSVVASLVVTALGVDERRDLRAAQSAQSEHWTVESDATIRSEGPAVLRTRRTAIGFAAAGTALAAVGTAVVWTADRRDGAALRAGVTPRGARLRLDW